MGVLNVSPESFHAGSVHAAADDLLSAALAMVEAGAVLIDVGARSTAPYLDTAMTDEEVRYLAGRISSAPAGGSDAGAVLLIIIIIAVVWWAWKR